MKIPRTLKMPRRSIAANRKTNRAKKMGGRDWPAASVDALLRGFGVYWLSWNAMIEPVADVRFQIERADYVALCEAAGVARPKCERGAATATRASQSFETGNHGGSSLKVTWDRLAGLDAELADRVWGLAQRYGYGREPPPRGAAR